MTHAAAVLFALGSQLLIATLIAYLITTVALRLGRITSPRVRGFILMLPLAKGLLDLATLDYDAWLLPGGAGLLARAPNTLALNLSAGTSITDALLSLRLSLDDPSIGSGPILLGDVLAEQLGPTAVLLFVAICAGLTALALGHHLIAGGAQLTRLSHSARAARPASLDDLHLDLRAALARYDLAVYTTDAPLPPMLYGLRDPRVIVGAAVWDALTPAQRCVVLRHELRHRQRRDHIVKPIVTTLGALFVWIPSVYHAARAWTLEAEKDCDRAALDNEASPKLLAETLLTVRTLTTRPERTPLHASFRSSLGRRVDFALQHKNTTKLSILRAAFIGALMLLALSIQIGGF